MESSFSVVNPATTSATTATITMTSTPTPTSSTQPEVSIRTASPVVAFMIGFSIICLASLLNAAGLNLTKLDHVRTSAIPKASRRKDWLRPLWLLGMILYIISQLIGSTLALEYMRAEYVAPLGSSSLVFNFLFARFLVGTPVTSNDIYGTIVVILGVIGIVAFGSINSGLGTETDHAHLTQLWRRGGWLGFFFCMAFSLIGLFMFTSMLDTILASRSDLSSVPFAARNARLQNNVNAKPVGVFGKLKRTWIRATGWIGETLENWTASKDDKQIAWTLGIGWACCGGGLAGGCLVFAKATVKLFSDSKSGRNAGNQFGHAAPIFTILLLVVTAVSQIICLNRGLKLYDSTLVVPVFYGVYTATGFLDALIFNDEVDAYQSWTLFLIFVFILVLISGVVLLTHKKPEPTEKPSFRLGPHSTRTPTKAKETDHRGLEGEFETLRNSEEGRRIVSSPNPNDTRPTKWVVGEDDDEDVDHHQNPFADRQAKQRGIAETGVGLGFEEGLGLMRGSESREDLRPSIGRIRKRSMSTGSGSSSDATIAVGGRLSHEDPFADVRK